MRAVDSELGTLKVKNDLIINSVSKIILYDVVTDAKRRNYFDSSIHNSIAYERKQLWHNVYESPKITFAWRRVATVY